jgi:hypothetical protein
MEIWKDIPEYGGHYQASNLGRIRSKERIVKKLSGLTKKIVEQKYKGKILNPTKADKYGHLSVHLGVDNKKYICAVHRLVLMAFVGKCPDGMECCHNNGDASDNKIENLRWDTHKNNNHDRKIHGNYKTGKDHPMYGRKMPEELKERLMKFHLGRKASAETKAKMSQAHKERWANVQKQKTIGVLPPVTMPTM